MDAETRREIEGVRWSRVGKLALFAALMCGIAGSRTAFAATPPQFVLQAGHTGTVLGIAFSPDGMLLASGSDDTTVILWNVQTGQMLCTLKSQNGAIRALAFSPDGNLLVTGADDGSAILWDASNGTVLRKLSDGNQIAIFSVAFSTDGKEVSAALYNNTIKVWDTHTGKLVLEQRGPKEFSRCAAISPDGKTVLASSISGRIGRVRPAPAQSSAAIWDARTGAILQTLEGASPVVGSAAFSADGKQLATGSNDSTAVLWDAQTGKKLQTLERHTQQVSADAFSPDGRTLATGSQDGSAILWDTQSGERLLTLVGRGEGVASLAFNPDGRLVATGGYEKITLWNTQTGQIVRTLSGHNIPISSVLISPDGKQIATMCDRTAVFWDATAGKRVASISGMDNAGINSLAFSADGSQVVTTSNQMDTALWDPHTGQKIRAFEGYQFPNASAAAISPDGKLVAMLSPMRNVVLWDAQSGSMLRTIPETPGAAPGRVNPNIYATPSEQFSSLAFSPDGKQIATTPVNSGGAVALWDVQTGHKVSRTFAVENNSFVFGAAFRPGGKEFAAISASGEVTFWEAQSGKKLRTLKQSADPAPALDPTDRRTAQQMARRIARQQAMAMQFSGGYSDMGRLASFAFSPDGKEVVIGSAGETATLWNVDTGKKVRELKGHCRRLSGTPFSKDGRFLVGVYDGGAAGLWDASTGDLVASLLVTEGGNEWIVVTPEGFFDGSPRGRRLATFRTGPGLKLVIGDKLGNDFYRPGLLSQILAGERPK